MRKVHTSLVFHGESLSLQVLRAYNVYAMDAQMIKTLQDYFATQPVLKAWVFGSFARGEETEERYGSFRRS